MGAKGRNKETGGLKIPTWGKGGLINDTQNPENVNAVIAVSSRRTTITGGDDQLQLTGNEQPWQSPNALMALRSFVNLVK